MSTPPSEDPAIRSYFSGKGYRDLWATIAESWQRNLDSAEEFFDKAPGGDDPEGTFRSGVWIAADISTRRIFVPTMGGPSAGKSAFRFGAVRQLAAHGFHDYLSGMLPVVDPFAISAVPCCTSAMLFLATMPGAVGSVVTLVISRVACWCASCRRWPWATARTSGTKRRSLERHQPYCAAG